MNEEKVYITHAESKIKESVINLLLGFANHQDFGASYKKTEFVTKIAASLGLNGLQWFPQRIIEGAEHIKNEKCTLNEINKLDIESKYFICGYLYVIAQIDGPSDAYVNLALTFMKLIGLNEKEISDDAPKFINKVMAFIEENDLIT